MSTYSIIRQAISDMHQITGMYDGYYREMCPHAIGTKNGKEQVLVYQFAGDTSKGPVCDPKSKQNWRCLEVSKLIDVKVKAGQWHTADNHRAASTCVDHIDVEVRF